MNEARPFLVNPFVMHKETMAVMQNGGDGLIKLCQVSGIRRHRTCFMTCNSTIIRRVMLNIAYAPLE